MNYIPNYRSRRKLFKIAGLGSLVLWHSPVIKSIVLPAHAQTSPVICESNHINGGPLTGNPYGAENCADACQGAAEEVGGQLCATEEITEGADVICHCAIEISPN
ncbi:MAG: hypothetical protein GY697_23325 [Desulfobacterales bacterium]|nr:hypothetical protein [Desulfobacterales bacterium]